MRSKTITKSFLVDFDAIIQLCAGFDTYFAEHPEHKKDFPRCNQPGYNPKDIKSREMFIGSKTESFTKLLDAMSIALDAAFLEAEYYLTPSGEGEIYQYAHDAYSIAFDFYIDPTAQIECCAISVSFPKDQENEITGIIHELQNNSAYVAKKIYDGDFRKLYQGIGR